MDAALQKQLSDVAAEMADMARRVTLRYFRTNRLDTQNKAGGGAFDPVTQADRACERALREILARRRPLDGILGEEEAPVRSQNGLTWVIDPIDGTRAFMSGMPCWGVLIAVNDGAAPMMGLIDQPFTEERFFGGFGRATYARGTRDVTPLATRSTDALEQAILYSTFPEIGSDEERRRFETVRDSVQLTRYGTDCYGYALLAMGQIDLVIEAGLSAYDIQGPMAVVAAAGGIVTDWEGGAAYQGGRVLAAANRDIHAKALASLAKL